MAAPTDLERGSKARRQAVPRALALLIVCVCCFLLMPAVYGLAAFHGHWRPMLKPEVMAHVAMNCLANAVVMTGALGVNGRLDQRLTEVLRRALLASGGLAFLILITRQFYSIPMMLIGVAASSGLGVAAILLAGGVSRPRIGVAGPWHWIVDDPLLDCRRLERSGDGVERVDVVVLTFDGDVPADWTPTVSRAFLTGKRVRHIAEFLEEDRGAVALQHFNIDDLEEMRLTRYRTRKRLLDLACVLAVAPLALPLVALASLGIVATMGAPVLFVQPRVGLGGRVFNMLKLRTMRPGAASSGAATVPDDQRITPLGRWLRRFRIDELPQLWNVMRGDMSFIGPRPEWTTLAERFSQQERTYAFRHLVRPGITGWAQVNTGPAATIAETRVKLGYDLFYIKNLSLGLDLQILARTVGTLIAGGGVR